MKVTLGIVVIAAVVVSVVLTALFVGVVGALFFESSFADGFDSAWDHPWRLALLWVLATFFSFGNAVGRN